MKAIVDCYVQIPFRKFVELFPDVAENIPMLDMFLSDPDYLVRLKDGKIEIGYSDDVWEIN